MTPTTAAVIAVRAAESRSLALSPSTYGAPRKIQRKHGTYVTHVTRQAARTAATQGFSPPGSR